MTLALVPVFVALGAFVGFLAGIMGVGGGFIMVRARKPTNRPMSTGGMALM